MERHGWVWLTLLLCLANTLAQDGSGDNADSGTDDREWKYVEFLKDISSGVEDILSITLLNARDNSFAGLDRTVQETLDQVMTIREKLLEEIRNLRKDDVPEDPRIKSEEKLSELRMEVMTILLNLVDEDAANVKNLKDISNLLLSFKQSLSNEIMRILMLPQEKGPVPKTPEGCEECEIFDKIRDDLKKLTVCVKEDNCTSPANMWFMDLILVTDKIDEEIKKLYNSLIDTTDDSRRQYFRSQLDTFKQLRDGNNGRDGIDEIISKMIEKGDEEDGLKTLVNRQLVRIVKDIENLSKECNEKCKTCDDCLVVKLEDTIRLMKTFDEEIVRNQDGESSELERVKEKVRTDLIEYINTNNGIFLNVLQIKAKNETKADDCDDRWSNFFKTRLKVPMWMLVNTTIFADYSEIELTIKQSIVLLEEMLLEPEVSDCPTGTPRPPTVKNCEWDEYEQTKRYLKKVDDIIQDSLFKDSSDGARVTALVGFVDIQKMLDDRVKVLYEDEIVIQCPAEIPIIKKEYMPVLNECLQDFMEKTNDQFDKLSRLKRISCTKQLRNIMETRMGYLLSTEVNRSIMDNFGSNNEGSGY